MMSAKMATPDLLKLTVFWNKGYDVIIPVNDVTKNYHVIQIIFQMCFCVSKFGNSCISMREVIITSIL